MSKAKPPTKTFFVKNFDYECHKITKGRKCWQYTGQPIEWWPDWAQESVWEVKDQPNGVTLIGQKKKTIRFVPMYGWIIQTGRGLWKFTVVPNRLFRRNYNVVRK